MTSPPSPAAPSKVFGTCCVGETHRVEQSKITAGRGVAAVAAYGADPKNKMPQQCELSPWGGSHSRCHCLSRAIRHYTISTIL
jgi:hypothetical protein